MSSTSPLQIDAGATPSAEVNGLPELPATEEREAGAVIHALWTGHDPARKPTADEKEQAEILRAQETKLAGEYFGTNQGLVRLVESRLWHQFGAVLEAPGRGLLKTSGQFDVTLVQPDTRRALVLDGKSGWLPVTPNPSNLQLRRLAALLWRQLGSGEIGVVILKPFAAPEAPCIYTESDLERSVLELEDDVRQSHDPLSPRTAGKEQCRYCRAREVCPTRLSWLSAAPAARLADPADDFGAGLDPGTTRPVSRARERRA